MRKGWLKHADHVPHRTNDNKMLQTMRFRHVLTTVLDGVRFLELWGFGNEGITSHSDERAKHAITRCEKAPMIITSIGETHS